MINAVDLLTTAAQRDGEHEALACDAVRLSYAELDAAVSDAAAALVGSGIGFGDRVCVYLEKRIEAVVALFAIMKVGAVAVPINPVLKPRQAVHILCDCGARLLVTSEVLMVRLGQGLRQIESLQEVITLDGEKGDIERSISARSWLEFLDGATKRTLTAAVIDDDLAIIFYTSGSTGMPKGVMVSHRNLIAGATSVAAYLRNNRDDRILCLLPISFDAGFSQLTTAFASGASAILHNFLLPSDVPSLCEAERITGITGVPPLWARLLEAKWPPSAVAHMRYFANTGGHMPSTVLSGLRDLFRGAEPYLMYGLTEAFRSTYLPPEQVEHRSDSIGKAIPNARVLVVDADGIPTKPGEIGELIHIGATVSLGYWNAPELTQRRFRPYDLRNTGGRRQLMTAVWSGDLARIDEDGFIYFVGRADTLIKRSGYRISATEIEEVVLDAPGVNEAVAFGVKAGAIGDDIVVAVASRSESITTDAIAQHCRRCLPSHMIPSRIIVFPGSLPRGPNGKFDHSAIKHAVGGMQGAL